MSHALITDNLYLHITMKKLFHIRTLVLAILVVSVLSFCICNIVFMVSYSHVFSIREWVWLPLAVLMLFMVWWLGNGIRFFGLKVSPVIAGFIVSNICYLTVLFTYDTHPVSDWACVWHAANEMANGTFTGGMEKGHYMHEIPYQLGLAYIESLIIRLFGSCYGVFQGINMVFLNLATFSVYHFTKRKVSIQAANYAFMAACLFLCFTMTVSQFTNHQMSFVLLYFALFLIEKDLAIPCLLSGVVVALLNFVRPMGFLIVASVCCFYLYKILVGRIYRRLALHLGLFLVGYFVVAFLLDTLLLSLSYTDERVSLSSRNKYHKISYTLYDSQVDGHIADYKYDYERYNEAYREEILGQFVNHPTQVAMNVANKMVRYLGLFDYLFEMTYNHDEKIWMQYPVKAVYSTQWFQYLLYLLLAIYGYIKYSKHNKVDVYQVFFVANTLVYVFIEAFTSYRFVNYFYLLFLVGIAFSAYNSSNDTISKGCSLNSQVKGACCE